MFPSINFTTTSSHPTRRTSVDAFGHVAPVATSKTIASASESVLESGFEDESVFSQRIWQSRTPDMSKIGVKRVFEKEANCIDRLSTFTATNLLVRNSVRNLHGYRINVRRTQWPELKQHIGDLLLKGSSTKSNHFLSDKRGIIIDGFVSKRWMKNLPLNRTDLFQRDYLQRDDNFNGGALAVASHPAIPDGIVAFYPSPTRKCQIRVAALSSWEADGLRCGNVFDVETPECDATQVCASSSHFQRVLTRGQDLLHLLEYGELDRGRSGVRILDSVSARDHNFRSRFRSMEFCPWIESEVVVASKDGDVRLWDLETQTLRKLFDGEIRFDDPTEPLSTQVLFGSHPRLILHANETGVALWDVRRRNNVHAVDLLGLPHSSLAMHERACVVARSRLNGHALYVGFHSSILTIDERMPNVPMGNFKHALSRRPQYAVAAPIKVGEEGT